MRHTNNVKYQSLTLSYHYELRDQSWTNVKTVWFLYQQLQRILVASRTDETTWTRSARQESSLTRNVSNFRSPPFCFSVAIPPAHFEKMYLETFTTALYYFFCWNQQIMHYNYIHRPPDHTLLCASGRPGRARVDRPRRSAVLASASE